MTRALNRTTFFPLAVAVAIMVAPSVTRGQADNELSLMLDRDNYQAWRAHIMPEAAELAWRQIPWLTTFKDGIIAANEADKPLLFWTMNGHPLGCT